MSNYILSMNPPGDCTPEEVERAINYFVALPLEELRHRQHINALATIATCDSQVILGDTKMEALRRLQAAGDHLRQAIARKELASSTTTLEKH